MTMQRIPRDRAMNYLFDAKTEPALRVEQEESFQVETEDAFSGEIRSPEDLLERHKSPTRQVTPHLSNPMGGPIFVEGAEKGDVLVVDVEEIVVDDIGRTCWGSHQGPLGCDPRWPELGRPHLTEIRHLPGPSGTTRDGRGVLESGFEWDLAPFIGTIGVAPDVEVETSAVGQGPWGGNLDCRDIRERTKVLIPVFHEGGLLHVGDVHAGQGDTEFYGTADECRSVVTLSCRVMKNRSIPYIRLEKPESIVCLYCFRPLETAVESAITFLIEWMVDEYGVSPTTAYSFASINPDFRVRVYQMVRIDRIQYTVGAEISKKHLR
jgi:acetamidase/formamidase